MIARITGMTPYLWLTIMFIVLIGLGSFNTSLQNISNRNLQQSIEEGQRNREQLTALRNEQIANIERDQEAAREQRQNLTRILDQVIGLVLLTNESKNIQVEEIEREQNQTAEILPDLLQSINDTAYIAERLPELITNTENVTDLVLYLSSNFGAGSDYLAREEFQYGQSNATANNVTAAIQKLDQILAEVS